MLSPLPVTAQAICIRQKALFLCLALLILVYFSISTRIRRLDYLTPNDLVRNTTIARVSERPGGSRHRILPCDVFSAAPTSLEELEAPTNAYITYFHLDAVGSDQDADIDPERNNLYLAARLLTYQLLHAPETKSKTGYPLIVMVSDAVPETMRDRLRKDGAIIYPVETIQPDWIVQNTQHSYATVATKFHAWRLTQFSRLLFLDLDTVLARSLDGVFESAASAPRMTRRLGLNDTSGASLFNHTMPSDYVLAANMELNEKEEHTYPPTDESASFQGPDYLNSGFFLIKPSMQLFDMYIEGYNTPDSFAAGLPEQALLNMVHNRTGAMPWVTLGHQWNMHFATRADMERGLHSLHTKFWRPDDEKLDPWLREWITRLKVFHETRDLLLSFR